MKKIALCFLSYNDIEQQAVWSAFLKDIGFDKYAIFIHRADGMQSTWMPNATLIPTKSTAWGGFSLVEVQQDLFNEAFRDPFITKFVLLSGDTVPLYSFAVIYEFLTRDDKGFLAVDTCDHTHKSRERTTVRRLWPVDRQWNWGVASQWSILNRMHVELLQEKWSLLSLIFGCSSVPDEHMYYVLFSGFSCIKTFHKFPVMSVDWKNKSSHCSIQHRTSPRTHHVEDFTQEYINSVYESGVIFLRKVCPLATLAYEWSADKPLIVNTSPPPVKKERPDIRRLMGGASRAKRDAPPT